MMTALPHVPERSRGRHSDNSLVELEIRKLAVVLTREVLVALWESRKEWGQRIYSVSPHSQELKSKPPVEIKITRNLHFADF